MTMPCCTLLSNHAVTPRQVIPVFFQFTDVWSRLATLLSKPPHKRQRCGMHPWPLHVNSQSYSVRYEISGSGCQLRPLRDSSMPTSPTLSYPSSAGITRTLQSLRGEYHTVLCFISHMNIFRLVMDRTAFDTAIQGAIGTPADLQSDQILLKERHRNLS